MTVSLNVLLIYYYNSVYVHEVPLKMTFILLYFNLYIVLLHNDLFVQYIYIQSLQMYVCTLFLMTLYNY